MTVCIGAVCPTINHIVLVSDHMLSNEWASSEGPPKFFGLGTHDQWMTMYAAQNASRAASLIRAIRAEVGDGTTIEILERACETAYRSELRRTVEQEILAPFGLSLSEFYAAAAVAPLSSALSDTYEKVANANLQVELLITGFDDGGEGHLWGVTTHGVAEERLEGFHAIGGGAYAALYTLNPTSGFRFSGSLAHVVYRLCAAKFAAEWVPGVGAETMVITMSRDGDTAILFGEGIEELRKLWLSQNQSVPEAAERVIERKMIRRPTWWGSSKTD